MQFTPWPKIARLNRDIVVTEKIDGTNAAIIIEESGPWIDAVDGGYRVPGTIARFEVDGRGYDVGAQSRKRLIWPGSDNFGFASWVADHAAELIRALGPGTHFGEWWGSGIQRGYEQPKGVKHFSLFNTARYAEVDLTFDDGSQVRPVPVLAVGRGGIDGGVAHALHTLEQGSVAAPGFDRPEGVVVFHTAANTMFKVLLEGDDTPKGA